MVVAGEPGMRVNLHPRDAVQSGGCGLVGFLKGFGETSVCREPGSMAVFPRAQLPRSGPRSCSAQRLNQRCSVRKPVTDWQVDLT